MQEFSPALKAYTMQLPFQFSPATSSRNSTSSGLTFPEMVMRKGADSNDFRGQLPAPWQLKTPTTPVSAFKFQIFSKLQNSQ